MYICMNIIDKFYPYYSKYLLKLFNNQMCYSFCQIKSTQLKQMILYWISHWISTYWDDMVVSTLRQVQDCKLHFCKTRGSLQNYMQGIYTCGTKVIVDFWKRLHKSKTPNSLKCNINNKCKLKNFGKCRIENLVNSWKHNMPRL